jgi:hypothetical protein
MRLELKTFGVWLLLLRKILRLYFLGPDNFLRTKELNVGLLKETGISLCFMANL